MYTRCYTAPLTKYIKEWKRTGVVPKFCKVIDGILVDTRMAATINLRAEGRVTGCWGFCANIQSFDVKDRGTHFNISESSSGHSLTFLFAASEQVEEYYRTQEELATFITEIDQSYW